MSKTRFQGKRVIISEISNGMRNANTKSENSEQLLFKLSKCFQLLYLRRKNKVTVCVLWNSMTSLKFLQILHHFCELGNRKVPLSPSHHYQTKREKILLTT